MTRNIRPNPYETPSGVKRANLARARAEREAKDETRGFGNPGVIGDIINHTVGERAMDSGLAQRATRRFEDPNAELGGLAVGIAQIPKTIRGRFSR